MNIPFHIYSFLFCLFCFGFQGTESIEAYRPNKDYALFFAVKDYDEWGDLRNPVKDAKAIAADLRQHYGFETEVVENPTRAQILQTLEAYRQKNYPKDAQLFVFFSGHGEFIESTKEGFFIPKEGRVEDPFQESYFPHSRLERAVTTIPCRHILLAIDACYSGTFDDALALGKGRPGQRPGETDKNERQRFIDRVLSYQSRLYLTSGGKERTPDGLDHSPFTIQFLAALRSFGGANKLLDFDELKSFMKEANPRPNAGQFEGHETGGDFLFVLDDRPVRVNDLRQDLAAWEQASNLNTLNAYKNYQARFPNGEFKGQATAKIQELEAEQELERDLLAWQRAKNLDTKTGYENYLLEFPNGKFQLLANAAIKNRNTSPPPPSSYSSGPPKDPAGRTYQTVELNGRVWLAENLNYDVGEGSWCNNGNLKNCEKFGRLYTWEAANTACTLLDDSWRLPTDEEWTSMFKLFGGYNNGASRGGDIGDPNKSYKALIKDGNSNFSVLKGGYRGPGAKDSFSSPNSEGYLWSSTPYDGTNAWYYSFTNRVNRNHLSKMHGFSCRCIKDE